MDKLETARAQISEIDRKMAQLFELRTETSPLVISSRVPPS